MTNNKATKAPVPPARKAGPVLPKISIDEALKVRPGQRSAGPGGDGGKRYRQSHPPQPAPRPPAGRRTMKGS